MADEKTAPEDVYADEAEPTAAAEVTIDAEADVTILLGGGRVFFRPELRSDGLDLVGLVEGRGYSYFEDPGSVDSVKDPSITAAMGLLADGPLQPAPIRGPLLNRMASAALERLMEAPEGFFLMVEGSQIDWAAHENDGERLIAETLDFDAAVGAVRALLMGRPNTLLVVTSDHETGGLSAEAGGASGEVLFTWTTTGHTAWDVPLFAEGAGAESFTGTVDNFRVGQILLGLVRQGSQ